MLSRLKPMPVMIPFASLLLLLPILLLSCGDGSDSEAALTREEVQEIVRAELANTPVQPAADSGLTQADVQEAVRAAIAELPQPESGLTSAEVEQIARGVVASIPPKTAPAEYTKFFVENAISRYEAEGLEATLAYYSKSESVDGQWYVFIFDEEGTLDAHHNSSLIGENLNGPLGTDAAGYEFGAEMLKADENGKWVSYVYFNPGSDNPGSDHFGDMELKNAWLVRHDGLLFGSGWYLTANDFAEQLVQTAVNSYRLIGLEGTMAAFASSDSPTAGLSETIAFYNSSQDVEGEWFAVIAEENGTIVAHYDPSLIGRDLADLYGDQTLNASLEGGWVSYGAADSSDGTDALLAYLVKYDGLIFGSGWHRIRVAH